MPAEEQLPFHLCQTTNKKSAEKPAEINDKDHGITLTTKIELDR
jgi:hypothetical protein